jgi:hypothetical protein
MGLSKSWGLAIQPATKQSNWVAAWQAGAKPPKGGTSAVEAGARGPTIQADSNQKSGPNARQVWTSCRSPRPEAPLDEPNVGSGFKAGARSAILDAEPPTFLGDAKHSTHPSPVRVDAMLSPRSSFFISTLLRASVQQRVQTTSKIFPPAPFSAAE